MYIIPFTIFDDLHFTDTEQLRELKASDINLRTSAGTAVALFAFPIRAALSLESTQPRVLPMKPATWKTQPGTTYIHTNTHYVESLFRPRAENTFGLMANAPV
jgi:hypothetical protein